MKWRGGSKLRLAALVSILAVADARATDTAEPAVPLVPVDASAVRLTDEFWKTRIERDVRVTIPHVFKKCFDTGRFDNFLIAAKKKEGKFEGYFFNDSDVYKLLEASSLALGREKNPELDKQVDDAIAIVAAAQEADGYLYTARTALGHGYTPPGGAERWSDLGGGHELYCAGHLYEAAAAHFAATGKKTLLDVAVKNADLVCRTFNDKGITTPDGHPEVEIGLVKLFQATGDRKYLEQAKFFLDVRGKMIGGRPSFGEYAQDHKPVREQTEAVGHAVRAAYLYSGMTDVGVLTNDKTLTDASVRLWDNVATSKTYLTGGIGSRGSGEAFGPAYELPNLTAYSETCASIAQALWSQRLLNLTGDAKYADAVERVTYNGFLSGVSLKGDEFFYVNPLECQTPHRRESWFGCACCPPNVARFMLEIPGLAYATRGPAEVFVNQYVASKVRVPIDVQLDSTICSALELDVETDYPRSGVVLLRVTPVAGTVDRDHEIARTRQADLAISLRIPGWASADSTPGGLYRYATPAQAVGLKVNGTDVSPKIVNGYAKIQRVWKAGDVIELDLPMPVRRVTADDRVEADRGRVALQRGPIVYAVELPDGGNSAARELLLPDDAKLETKVENDLLGGVTTITAVAKRVGRDAEGKIVATDDVPLVAIPYYAWANRAPGPMAVWLARDVAAAKPLPLKTVAFTSKVSVSGGCPTAALNDQSEPVKSYDPESGFFHWWPRKGTSEWVQYDFAGPTRIAAAEVYWFDDTGVGECRLPKSWSVLAKIDGEWKPVADAKTDPIAKDKFNRVTFTPVTADGLRVVVQLADNVSAGINEMRVVEAGK